MSLGIAFKGPEGIVLAADSRATLMRKFKAGNDEPILTAYYDNATKLLRLDSQKYVAAVTFGLAAIGAREPRTANSYLPELDNRLQKEGVGRLTVEGYSQRLSDFFTEQWQKDMPKDFAADPMMFLIGGYDSEEAVYGRVYEFNIPYAPKPIEVNAGNFGIKWGGQNNLVTRLIKGFDEQLPGLIQQHLKLSDKQREEIHQLVNQQLKLPIPYQFLPLQDCVNFAIFLIRMTMDLQSWMVDIRGVGGEIDVAIITRSEGIKIIQQKQVRGEYDQEI